MDSVLDAPAAVYVALMVATLLLLVEIALPTFGIAGTAAFVLGALGVAGIVRGDLVWWPLLIAVAGIALWTVELARRRNTAAVQVGAGICFAAGSIGFGIAAADPVTVVAAVLGSVAVPFAYPRLHAATKRLMDMPPDVGMESLVGRTAEVVRWERDCGSITLDGSYWSAFGPEDLGRGDRVVVAYVDGMRARVERTGDNRQTESA